MAEMITASSTDPLILRLDAETSRIIDQVVASWFKDWTVIAVAHKLEPVLSFDKVAVLDQGQLLEFDEPKTLMKRDSAFRSLYEHSRAGATSPSRVNRSTNRDGLSLGFRL